MQNYNSIQKFLHDIVFSNKLINKFLFDIEKIFYLKKLNVTHQQHIFITSLPRSGTTSLLNFLYDSNHYASLTYKNMPFVMSPHFSKLFNRKKIPTKERLHGDGIYFNLESPEALDEVFFSNYEESIKNELENYVQLILKAEKKSNYLSKNNLNYKRINLLNTIFPNSIFLIPIREPLYHANSLLNQHLNFIKIQQKNDFVKRYMNYIGHNEFGKNHKPWNKPIEFEDLNDLNYWLEQWYLFFKNILAKYKNNHNCIFVVYEKLQNKDYLIKILKKINHIKLKNFNLNYFKKSNGVISKRTYSNSIYNKAENVYKIFTEYD